MRKPRSAPEAPFRLRQESCSRSSAARGTLEAWPTGQGDYFLAGRDTYPFRARISAVGGRWDNEARKWFVTREQATRLGAAVLCRVIRAPACCEKHLDALRAGVEALATRAEVMSERMTVRFCPLCDSVIYEVVAIRDILDPEEIPPPPEPEPQWAQDTRARFREGAANDPVNSAKPPSED
jgi:hypothetical protein